MICQLMTDKAVTLRAIELDTHRRPKARCSELPQQFLSIKFTSNRSYFIFLLNSATAAWLIVWLAVTEPNDSLLAS